MGLGRVGAVGHLALSWQQLRHQVLYTPDSTHELSEEEAVEGMTGLAVLLSLPDLDPMQPETQVSFQNESLTY